MGITKLLHIKERKKGNPSAGLLNSIYYILNPEKTQNKRLVGGNCGRDEEMIYQKFVDTKSAYGKRDGRQGYHFVISFPPEENVSTKTCMNVISDFVDEYLKNEYDVVFTVHDDQEHMHGHIVFNSVNSITGKKYRYEDGDWEKYIQPITDKIAKRYGLSELDFVPAEEELKIDWKKKIQEDISECVKTAKDYEDFKEKMQTEYHYKIREGYSKKHGIYLSYKPEGKGKAIRSYQLPKSCQPYDIARRIALRDQDIVIVPVVKAYFFGTAFYKGNLNCHLRWDQMSVYQKANARKVYQAQKLYHRKNNNSTWENERIVRGINQTMKRYHLMMKNNFTTEEDVIRFQNVQAENLKEVNKEIRKCKRMYSDFISGEPSIFDMYEEMTALKRKESLTPEESRKVQEMEETLELNYIGEMYQKYQTDLSELYAKKEQIKKDLRLARGISPDMAYFQQGKEPQKREKEYGSKEKEKKYSEEKSNQK